MIGPRVEIDERGLEHALRTLKLGSSQALSLLRRRQAGYVGPSETARRKRTRAILRGRRSSIRKAGR